MLINKPISVVYLYQSEYAKEEYAINYRTRNIHLYQDNINDYTKLVHECLIKNTKNTHISNSYVQVTDLSTIRIKLNYFDTIMYNYCEIVYEDYTRLFCYINGYEIINNEVTSISLQIDSITTFLPKIKHLRGLLDRSHTYRYYKMYNSSFILPSRDCMFSEGNPPSYYTNNHINSPYEYLVSVYVFSFPSNTIVRESETDKYSVSIIVNDKAIGEIGKVYFGYNNYNLASAKDNNGNSEIVICSKIPSNIGNISPIQPTEKQIVPLTPKNLELCFPFLVEYLKNVFFIPYTFVKLNEEASYITSFDESGTKIKQFAYCTQIPNYSYFKYILNVISNRLPTSESEETDRLQIPTYAQNDFDKLATLYAIDNTKGNDIKLECYPFTYYSCMVLNNEVSYKINDIPYNIFKWILTAESKQNETSDIIDRIYLNLFQNISYSVDPLSSVANVDISYTLSYANGLQLDYKDGNTQYYRLSHSDYNYPLYSVNIYQSVYTQYLNYTKAMVESNNKYANINAGMSMANAFFDMQSQQIQGSLELLSGFIMPYNKYLPILGETTMASGGSKILNSGRGFISNVVSNVLNINKRYEQIAITENNLKRKPPQQTIQGNMYNLGLYGEGNRHVQRIIYNIKHSITDTEKRLYNTLFRLYGYHIPIHLEIDLEGKSDKRFNTMTCGRKTFNYIKFSDISIRCDDLSINYINDMERRLMNGVTLYHFDELYNFVSSKYNEEDNELLTEEERPHDNIYGIFNNNPY